MVSYKTSTSSTDRMCSMADLGLTQFLTSLLMLEAFVNGQCFVRNRCLENRIFQKRLKFLLEVTSPQETGFPKVIEHCMLMLMSVAPTRRKLITLQNIH